MKILTKIYQESISNGELIANPQQAQLVTLLQEIHDQLSIQEKERGHWLKRHTKHAKHPVMGLYIWGPVGVGKTRLLDLLYNNINIPKKRQHFHAFMNDIHQELFKLQGHPNPMRELTRSIGANIQLLFLDEFIVNDIADAMVLAGLLEGLFKEGVCLITCSNTEPDNLYTHGFQRKKFLPTIELLKTKTQVMKLSSECDYRRNKNIHERYITPIDESTHNELELCFKTFSDGEKELGNELLVLGRKMSCIRHSKSTLWASCKQLCSPPRCSRGYIDLASRFEQIIISDIPIFKKADIDSVSRFIRLIDILYDQNIDIVISAEAPVDELYPEGKLTERFQRTRSRISEMT